jgi:hypothetical protein
MLMNITERRRDAIRPKPKNAIDQLCGTPADMFI